MYLNRHVLNRVLAGVAILVVFSSASADILHVPGDYRTIQEAIDAAMDGDEVEVHPGTYNEAIDFLGKAITVRSSDGPQVTIIDGWGTTVTCNSGEGPETVLDGFTVTGGSGSGMRNVGSSPRVVNCTFSGNWTYGDGAGMYNSGGSPTVTNCTFSGNWAGFGKGEGGEGGGMYNFNSSPAVTNCTFTRNQAGSVPHGGSGGGMYNSGGSNPTVTNCTFSGNFGLGSGGAMYNSGGSPTVTNCILWGKSTKEILDGAGATTTVSFSDVQGGWPGIGNINTDPLFVDPDGPDNDPYTFDDNDYRLAAGSPSIDAGNNWGVPIDADDYDGDGNTAELFPVDLDGHPRFNADEADFDPGCGVPVVVDMGAYEYQFDPVDEIIFADLNADGAVGILDLLGVLAAWGDPGTNCLADLDIDGAVGILDLLTLLSNWG